MTTTEASWDASAQAWIDYAGEGDTTRTVLLDGPVLYACGDVSGKQTLDIGCGEGRFSRMLAKLGARTYGIDPTQKLISTARSRHPEGCYLKASGEVLPFKSAQFDLAIFYLTLIDIPDFRAAIREAARVLRPGGRLVAANIACHASTRAGSDGWIRDSEGRRIRFEIDDYLEEYSLEVSWKGIAVENWHRPLQSYMEAYLSCGLILNSFEEPAVPEEEVEKNPDWSYNNRVPFTNLMRWVKPNH